MRMIRPEVKERRGKAGAEQRREERRGEESVRVDPSLCRPVSASLSALADRVNGRCEKDSCGRARVCFFVFL